MKYLAITGGGALGALMRYIVSGWAYRLGGESFPIGTLAVNVIGSFAIGFLWDWFDRHIVPQNLRLFLIIGILGGFTTFSSFSLETANLMRDADYRSAAMNVFANNAACIAAVFFGLFAARWVAGVIR